MTTLDAREATRDIKHDLRAERWRDDVSREELLDVNARLAGLEPEEREQVIAGLSDDELARWGDEMHESGLFGGAGLSATERGELHTTLARDIGVEQLTRVHTALDTPDRQAELVDAVERHATAPVREGFTAAIAARSIADASGPGMERADVERFAAAVETLDPAAVDALIAGSDDAALAAFGDELFETTTLGFGDRGLDATERRALFDTLAAKAGPESLQRLTAAFGAERGTELVRAVASGASLDTRVGFVQVSIDAAPAEGGTRAGPYTTRLADPALRSAATVLATLRGESVGEALTGTTSDERVALISAAGDTRVTVRSHGGNGGSYAVPTTSFDTASFTALVDAFASVPDPSARARLAGESVAALDALHAAHELGANDRRTASGGVLATLDDATLERLSPEATAPLADALTAGGRGASAETLAELVERAPSPARDALVRTVFAKTPGSAFARDPALANAMAPLLVSTTGDALDASGRREAHDALVAQLSSDSGRALLADADVPAAARLWALEQVMARPLETAALVGDAERPWESAALLELHAAARVEQHALGRGDRAIEVTGLQIENLIGTSAGAAIREDIPDDLESITDRLADGTYNAYEGNEAVDRIAAGVRARLDDWNVAPDGGTVGIAAVPIQFSSQASGPVDLVVYRVEGPDGRSAIVDNIGRTYDDVEQWLAENELPPGVVTYPEGLALGDGTTPTALATRVTPNVRDTAWEHVAHWGDIGALALGTVASGVLIVGSGGLATPVVAGAWAVAGGATIWTTARSGAELVDRYRHDQTLSLADPDARAAWIGVAAGGLTIAGGGTALGARAAANGSRTSQQLARASGILGASANVADIGATVEQAATLYADWDELPPAARAQMMLGIAFWGVTTGANARLNGGRVADVAQPDAFRLRMERAAIDSGARVTPNADLAADTARIVRTEGGALAIEHAPNASPEVIAAHRDAAQSLITNGGIEGMMARLAGAPDAYPPNSRGERAVIEVAKYEQLLDGARARLDDPALAPAERTMSERLVTEYEHSLAYERNVLETLRANPDAARLPDAEPVEKKPERAFLIGVGENDLARTAAAERPFDALVDPALRALYPDAVPVTLADLDGGLRFTLADGTETAKTGGRGSTDIRQMLLPPEQGGLGGAVFHDPSTDTMIVAVNMRSNRAPDVLDRVEVPYARDANGEWRADFSHVAVYETSIPSDMIRRRGRHFGRANENLAAELAADPALVDRLGLGDVERGIVDRGLGRSPQPYTWHHVDGGGGMLLVDEHIHGFFPHHGGFSEWGTTP